jgi:hypothetical protein
MKMKLLAKFMAAFFCTILIRLAIPKFLAAPLFLQKGIVFSLSVLYIAFAIYMTWITLKVIARYFTKIDN